MIWSLFFWEAIFHNSTKCSWLNPLFLHLGLILVLFISFTKYHRRFFKTLILYDASVLRPLFISILFSHNGLGNFFCAFIYGSFGKFWSTLWSQYLYQYVSVYMYVYYLHIKTLSFTKESWSSPHEHESLYCHFHLDLSHGPAVALARVG